MVMVESTAWLSVVVPAEVPGVAVPALLYLLLLYLLKYLVLLFTRGALLLAAASIDFVLQFS
jgi:hypothetical protein